MILHLGSQIIDHTYLMRGLFIYLHLESKAGKQGKKGRIRQIKDEEKVKRSNICTQGGEVPGKRLPEKYINTGVWQTGQILGGGGGNMVYSPIYMYSLHIFCLSL
jgi:hypothetical protein